MMYLLLLVLGLSGALALAWYFKLDAAATAATLLPALAPAYLSWKSFQHNRAEAPAVDLDTAADQLTQAVKNQWDDEAAIRRLNDPYPLPVGWRAADPDLVEPWELLTEAPGPGPVVHQEITPSGQRTPRGSRAPTGRSARCSPNGCPPAAWWSSARPVPAKPLSSSACSRT